MNKVAALYVDPRGPYPGLLGEAACWGESRNAKLYPGPYPVVAHPPCGPWGRLRHMCTKQDPECGMVAPAQVRMYGGVLEHPAHSRLWDWAALPKPGDATDEWGGRTYEVDQCDWGHKCRKSTWLYVVRVDQAYVMRKLRERRGGGIPTHCVSRDARRKSSKLLRADPRVCRLTPPVFAKLLVAFAERVEPRREA